MIIETLFNRSRALGALVGMLVGGVVMVAAAPAQANERHYTYTYESAGMPEGARELEIWTTARYGRERFYSAIDNRLELEFGLSDRLLTAFYLNTSGVREDTGTEIENHYELQGISSEWKYKLSDAVADALGSALYAEATYGLEELELEAKLILDKRLGDVHLAGNAVYELEVEGLGEDVEVEHIVEVDLAGAYRFTPTLSLGVEGRARTVIEHGEVEHVTFFTGPVVAFGSDAGWGALSFLGQVGSLGEHEGEAGAAGEEEEEGFGPNLVNYERINIRLILGMSI
jgi:hypothetical protein